MLNGISSIMFLTKCAPWQICIITIKITITFFMLSFWPIEGNGQTSDLLSKLHTQQVRGERISKNFYSILSATNEAKIQLQTDFDRLANYLRSNLSVMQPVNAENMSALYLKANESSSYFHNSTLTAAFYMLHIHNCFEAITKESHNLFVELKNALQNPVLHIESTLADHLADLEYIEHVFVETLDDAKEYILYTLSAIKEIFQQYANIQQQQQHSIGNLGVWCSYAYLDFIQLWSNRIFHCATNNNLHITYDIYAITEMIAKYMLTRLQFYISCLENCYIHRSQYAHRCVRVLHMTAILDKLFLKVEELQQHIYMKTKRVFILENCQGVGANEPDLICNRCLPNGFPYKHMPSKLKNCFLNNSSLYYDQELI